MNKNANEAAPSIDRAFLNIITSHRNGAAISDISGALKKVTAAVQLTGKEGKVTITLKLRPASSGDAGTLVFEPSIKTTLPEVKPAGSIFYADDDFNLVRDNPNQANLNLKVIESATASTAPLKKVEPAQK